MDELSDIINEDKLVNVRTSIMSDCKFKVSVRCYTYNQAPFIADTLKGFCIQNTEFPYICLVVDDASTDDEQVVINEYLRNNFEQIDTKRPSDTDDFSFFLARHKTNHNCYFACFFLKYNHHGKKDKKQYLYEWLDNTPYQAICEGDDYWIDPYKLQKQVDYLDEHPECGLVYTDFTCVNTENEVDLEAQRRYEKCRELSRSGYLFDYCFMNDGFILMCTICYRSSLYDAEQASLIDTSLFMTLARQSTIYYMPEVTSCYRNNPDSLMHTRLKYIMDITFQIKFNQLYYVYKYKETTARYYFETPACKNNFSMMYTYCVLYWLKKKARGLSKLLYVSRKSPKLPLLFPLNLIKLLITHKF